MLKAQCRNILFISCCLIFCGFNLEANKTDITIVNNYFAQYKDKSAFSSNDLMVKTALHFLETPYVASTLEKNDTERLVVNLREFDCTTFVENCIAFTHTLQSDTLTFNHFTTELQHIRYRKGNINGYTSRLHYTSDWITDNTSKQILSDRTKEIGGEPLHFNLNFMSTHPESYKALKNNPEDIVQIQVIENAVNQRTYYYIPKNEISKKENEIKDGDIVCFVTTIEGLDISHLGIAYRKNGILTFIHASTLAKKVIINPESLADYCDKSKRNQGIIVLRVEK